MANFITILEDRILKSTIKRYKPREDVLLIIYFSASKTTRVDCEIFKFPTKKERDEVLIKLDSLL